MCACAHAGARALKNGESILPELYGVRCGEKGTNRAVRRPAPDAGRMSGRHLRLCILPLVAFWGGDWYIGVIIWRWNVSGGKYGVL